MANSAQQVPLRSAKQITLRVKLISGALYTKAWRMRRKKTMMDLTKQDLELILICLLTKRRELIVSWVTLKALHPWE